MVIKKSSKVHVNVSVLQPSLFDEIEASEFTVKVSTYMLLKKYHLFNFLEIVIWCEMFLFNREKGKLV